MKALNMSFDYPGAMTLAIGLASFLAVIDLQDQLSWGHPVIIGTSAIGAASALAFFAFETCPGNRELLIPLRLLKTGVGAFCAGQVSPPGPKAKKKKKEKKREGCGLWASGSSLKNRH